MNKYQSIAQVEQALEPFVSIASMMTGKGLTIDRTLRLAELVGNPQDDMRVVHVAGTSGKTSTSYHVSDLLMRAGNKVGLTVSPHIDSITERVQVGGKPLPEEAFCAYFGEFMKYVEALDDMPTYFELMMVFAYWVFRKENVDYAVIETGLGGQHDSSNIASRTDKVCVLTDIGYDHMHVLGRTLEEISAQKVGIVKPGNVLVMHEQSSEVMRVVSEYVKKQQGSLIICAYTEGGTFQRRNWNLAYSTFENIRVRDRLSHIVADEIEKSQGLDIPGRMDIFQRSGKTIILDGAHNEQKMNAFLAALTQKFPGTKFPVLLTLKQGKELRRIAPLVVPYASAIITTELRGSQDARLASIKASEIAKVFTSQMDEVQVECSLASAIEKLLTYPEDVVVVTGSLHLVAKVRKLLHTV